MVDIDIERKANYERVSLPIFLFVFSRIGRLVLTVVVFYNWQMTLYSIIELLILLG